MRQVAPRLVGSIDRAIALCAQTLRFGKAEERAPEPERFVLHDFAEDVAAGLALPDESTIRWHNAVPAGLTVYADGEHLYRTLNNLIRNAAQAMPEGGDIRIAAAISSGSVIIEIADTGCGLSAEAQKHLFEPFRGGRTGGTGLGLAIARELARAHGGDIELARTGPLGTTFRIILPDPRG